MDLKRECLIAVPINKGDEGEVIGIYTIQMIPLLNLNSATINLLGFLSNWASRSIQRAYYFKDLKAQEILDPELGIYSYTYFKSRLEQEFSKSVTYYLPLSVILIKIQGIENLKPGQIHDLRISFSQLLKSSLRKMDVIAACSEGEIHFACMLTTIDTEQALNYKEQILTNFKKLNLPFAVKLNVGTSSFTPKTSSFDNMIAEAKQKLKNAA